MKTLLLTSLLFFTILTYGQEQLFTLHRYTPLLYSPTVSSEDNHASISIFREEYSLGSGDFISTDVVNAEYPIIRKTAGRRLGGVGVSFMKREAGESDLLNTYLAGLSLSNQIQLASSHYLNLGIAGNYYNKRTSVTGLSTGAQWLVEEFRYDPNTALGENFESANISFFSLGAGVKWQLIKDQLPHAFVGLSAFHLNQPNESFFRDQANVPVTYLLQAGTVLYSNRRVVLTPQLYHARSEKNHNTQAMLATRLLFENNNPYDIIRSGSIEILLNYDFKQDATLGLVFNQPGFSLGMSYNFPVGAGERAGYLKNAFQIGLSLSKAIWKKQPKKVVITAAPQRRDFNFDRPVSDNPPAQASEVDLIKEKLGELSDVRALQFELSKDFKFGFGQAELSPEAAPFLEELYQLLLAHPDFSLTIVGHTDNVGKQQLNYQLSLDRAQAVADRLLNKGLDASRIQVIGKGDTEPLNDNETAQEQANNRRVVFIINVEAP